MRNVKLALATLATAAVTTAGFAVGIEQGTGIWYENALMGFTTYYPKTWKSTPHSNYVNFREAVEAAGAGSVDINFEHIIEAQNADSLYAYLEETYPEDTYAPIDFKGKAAFRANSKTLSKIYVLKAPSEVLLIQFHNQVSPKTELDVLSIINLMSWRESR